MVNLGVLPNEILSLVTNYLERPLDMLHLSLVNRRLHEFVELDGWREFLKGRLGLSCRDSDARNTVHGVTTLYRNWDRKAFVARYLTPSANTTCMNTWVKRNWNPPSGQTMGYQPSIDSYEEILGSWSDRRETLAWSAGTNIVMRVKESGLKAAKARIDQHQEGEFDNYKNLSSWYTYQMPETLEGRDDITDLKLLRPHQRDNMSNYVAFGTASGDLSLLRIDLERLETKKQDYDTKKRPVGSLSISSSKSPLMAATIGGTSIALYPINTKFSEDEEQQSLSQLDFHAKNNPLLSVNEGRLRCCNFISNDKIAVGLGPAVEPIQVFEVTPTGFSSEPIRTFSHSRSGDYCLAYPIVPVSSDSQAGSDAGHVFLSGGHDGITRLHDMRSPSNFEMIFWDVTNDSSIYSLITQGSERVIAGSSRHSMLKVFDLRLSGSHAYHSIQLPSQAKLNSRTGDYAENQIVRKTLSQTRTTTISGGWNAFLHPRNHDRQRSHHARMPRNEDSSVYSLSIPSATSPSIYAGLEGAVMALDFISITDKHPDPFFAQTVKRFPDSNGIDIKRSYNPADDVLNLGMYEQGTEKALGMRLMVQESVSMEVEEHAEKRDNEKFAGLDERWRDPSDDGDRWTRGHQLPEPQEPQGRRGRGGSGTQSGRGGRGRGRGRGTNRGRGV